MGQDHSAERARYSAVTEASLETGASGDPLTSKRGWGAEFFPDAGSFDGSVDVFFPDIFIMHRPSAHMAAQGKTPRISGASPAATSQLQLKKSPATIATPAIARSPVRLADQARRVASALRLDEVCGESIILEFVIVSSPGLGLAFSTVGCPFVRSSL
jgi:hypothetical protein